MLDADPSFRPVPRHDGYLALEDMGRIGGGTTSALPGHAENVCDAMIAADAYGRAFREGAR